MAYECCMKQTPESRLQTGNIKDIYTNVSIFVSCFASFSRLMGKCFLTFDTAFYFSCFCTHALDL